MSAWPQKADLRTDFVLRRQVLDADARQAHGLSPFEKKGPDPEGRAGAQGGALARGQSDCDYEKLLGRLVSP